MALRPSPTSCGKMNHVQWVCFRPLVRARVDSADFQFSCYEGRSGLPKILAPFALPERREIRPSHRLSSDGPPFVRSISFRRALTSDLADRSLSFSISRTPADRPGRIWRIWTFLRSRLAASSSRSCVCPRHVEWAGGACSIKLERSPLGQ